LLETNAEEKTVTRTAHFTGKTSTVAGKVRVESSFMVTFFLKVAGGSLYKTDWARNSKRCAVPKPYPSLQPELAL
jgi:hypothetical protein